MSVSAQSLYITLLCCRNCSDVHHSVPPFARYVTLLVNCFLTNHIPVSFSNQAGSNKTGKHHLVNRQVAKSGYIEGTASVPSSPSEYKKDFSSRSSSPALSSRSASPGSINKRRSHSRSSDDSFLPTAVRQTKSSNIRRAHSINAVNQPPSTPTKTVTRKYTHKSLQRSQTIAESPSLSKRRPNTLMDNKNNNAITHRIDRNKAPSIGRAQDIPVHIVTS